MSVQAAPNDVSAAFPRPYRVVDRRTEIADTVSLALASGFGAAPAFAPGQFAMLTAFGIGEVPISVSGLPQTGAAPADGLVCTVRAVGAVTTALQAMRPGDVVGVRGPFGTSWDVPSALGHDVVVIAGGIGLAPLRPVLHAIVADRSRYGRVALLVGARTPGDVLYGDELRTLADARIRVDVTVDRPADGWTGHVGVVTTIVPAAEVDPADTVAFVCGPEVMMRFSAEALVARGVSPERIRVSLERNMRCGVGWCGHCQLGPVLVCRDGPVVAYTRAEPLMRVREL